MIHIAAMQELWRRGEAWTVRLDASGPTGGQQAWFQMLNSVPPSSWAALEIARQRGKTFTVLDWLMHGMGLEQIACVYLAQTGENAEAIVGDWFRAVEPQLPPEWGARLVDGAVRLAGGASLEFFGTDNKQYRRRRGRAAKRVVLDEAGFYSDLADVEQVYQPQLMTTGGIGVYLSSPALNPAHDFSARCDALQRAGRYVRDTFWNNPRISHEQVIHGEMERLGLTREELLRSTYFRREYLAERATEETRAALPAWTDEARAALVGDWVRPVHFDAYVSLDVGKTGDPHAASFGYHDPATNTLTLEDEIEMPSAGTHIGLFVEAVKRKEAELWGVDRWAGTLLGAGEWLQQLAEVPEHLRRSISDSAPRQPYLRVGDDDARLIVDMAQQHGTAVMPSAKHDKAVWVDTFNQRIRERRIRVHARCVRTLEQWRSTLWNGARSQWERTPRDHGDLVDCPLYMVRNVRWHRDCRPHAYDHLPRFEHEKKTGWDQAFRRPKR